MEHEIGDKDHGGVDSDDCTALAAGLNSMIIKRSMDKAVKVVLKEHAAQAEHMTGNQSLVEPASLATRRLRPLLGWQTTPSTSGWRGSWGIVYKDDHEEEHAARRGVDQRGFSPHEHSCLPERPTKGRSGAGD